MLLPTRPIDGEFIPLVQLFGYPNLQLILSGASAIIDVHGSDDIQVQTGHDSAMDRLKIDLVGDTIVINEMPKDENYQQQLRVIVPVGTPIDIRAHSSNITIADTHSSIRASISGHGSVTAQSARDLHMTLRHSSWVHVTSVIGSITAALTDTAFARIDTADCTFMAADLDISSRIEVLKGSVETLKVTSSRSATLLFDGIVARLKMTPCCAGDIDISEIRVIDGEGE